MTPSSDEPTAQAHAVIERVLALVREYRWVMQALEHPPKPGESSSAEAERIFYYTLMSAVEALRTEARSKEGVSPYQAGCRLVMLLPEPWLWMSEF